MRLCPHCKGLLGKRMKKRSVHPGCAAQAYLAAHPEARPSTPPVTYYVMPTPAEEALRRRRALWWECKQLDMAYKDAMARDY